MEKMCDRCNEEPSVTYNYDHHEAVCKTCADYYFRHSCAGEHCVCIGGDVNFDREAQLQDEYEAYCLARVAPFEGE